MTHPNQHRILYLLQNCLATFNHVGWRLRKVIVLAKSVITYDSCIQITCFIPLSKAYNVPNTIRQFSTHVRPQRPRKSTKKFQKNQVFSIWWFHGISFVSNRCKSIYDVIRTENDVIPEQKMMIFALRAFQNTEYCI